MSYRIHFASDLRLQLGTGGRIASCLGGEWEQDEETDYTTYHLVLNDWGNGEAWIEQNVSPSRLRGLAARLNELADELDAMVTVTIRVGNTSVLPPDETVTYTEVRIPAPPVAFGIHTAEYRGWAWENLICPFAGSDQTGEPGHQLTIIASDDPTLIGRVLDGG